MSIQVTLGTANAIDVYNPAEIQVKRMNTVSTAPFPQPAAAGVGVSEITSESQHVHDEEPDPHPEKTGAIWVAPDVKNLAGSRGLVLPRLSAYNVDSRSLWRQFATMIDASLQVASQAKWADPSKGVMPMRRGHWVMPSVAELLFWIAHGARHQGRGPGVTRPWPAGFAGRRPAVKG